ncbi:zinc-binding alcohol dehydrogenase family protein [Aspergillus lucknowensis]|uniref:GroES-like protein n=1 Tax=Aspergillus lucknowensis TaxID=176173 RepID=A0ABR4M478_9EURO
MVTLQKALIVEEIGKPLKLTKRPIPRPEPGWVLVKVVAAGINPHDRKSRDKGYLIESHVPGEVLTQDIAGTVVSLGDNVTKFAVGDRIFGQSDVLGGPDQGGLQQYVVLHADYAAKIPDGLSFDEAATIPVNAVAGFVALFHESGFGLTPAEFNSGQESVDYSNETILVIGGGSNTGKFGLQFAKLAGFGRVVTTASTRDAAKVDYLKSLGATHVIDREAEDVVARIRELVGDDLLYAYDTINGGKNQGLGLAALSNSRRGSLVTLVRGEVDPVQVEAKKAGFRKEHAYGASNLHGQFSANFWAKFPEWIQQGKLRALDFQVIEGLDEEKVNRVLDDYRDGRAVVQAHVHPNAAE